MQMKGLIRNSMCVFLFPHSSSEEHPGASKPPISSSSMTSRILLRQQLMREQMQEQERREQQQKLQAAQFMQQRVPVSQTPAINVSVPTTLPSATQVPMEVLKVCECHSCWLGQAFFFFNIFHFPGVLFVSSCLFGYIDLSETYL